MRVRVEATGAVVELPHRAVMGRGSEAHLRAQAPFASKLHARVEWSGEDWRIRDLGSRNGTFLNRILLDGEESRRLSVGDTIGLGDLESTLTVLTDDAPGPAAYPVEGGAPVLGSPSLLALPAPEAPTVSVVFDGHWRVEDEDGTLSPLPADGLLTASGRRYRVELPRPAERTPHLDVELDLPRSTLTFLVSQDEERVELVVERLRRRVRLEGREHGYLLLLLSRARREDIAQGQSDPGWRSVDELCRMLRTDPTVLNVLVYRARRQFEAAGVASAPAIVEVRRGARRLGVSRSYEERLA